MSELPPWLRKRPKVESTWLSDLILWANRGGVEFQEGRDVLEILEQGATFQGLYKIMTEGDYDHQPRVWWGNDAFVRVAHAYTNDHEWDRRWRCLHLHLHLGLGCEKQKADAASEGCGSSPNVIKICVCGELRKPTPLVDIVFRLIAVDETVQAIRFFNPEEGGDYVPVLVPQPISIPASPSALEFLVSRSPSTRSICFGGFLLENDHIQALLSQRMLSCNFESMTLRLDHLIKLDQASVDEFFLRLQSSMSVKKLRLIDHTFFLILEGGFRLRFCEALAQFNGLESLLLNTIPSTDGILWDILWKSISQHASLKEVHVRHSTNLLRDVQIPPLAQEQRKVCRTQSIIRALESNHRLNTITGMIDLFHGSLDEELMNQYVWPKLTWNRFRPRAQSLRQEPDRHVRLCLLGQALQHPSLLQSPTICYLFLSQNADLIHKLIAVPTTKE